MTTSLLLKASYIHGIKNSSIAFRLIEDYHHEYQSLLEGISDYLLDQIKWWEEPDHGVMFYDIENNQTSEAIKLKMYHFWSYSLKEEWERTRNCGNISPSKPALYQQYQTKLTADNISESTNNNSFMLKSDKIKIVKYNKISIFNPIQSCVLI